MHINIFTEGSKTLGLGHVIRCCELYDCAEEKGINVQLIINGDIEEKVLKGRNYKLINWSVKEELKKIDFSDAFAIIDSYTASENLYTEIKKLSNHVIYIDDFNRLNYPDGTIVNPALKIDNLKYKNPKKIKYGANYIILRSLFRSKNEKLISDKVRNIFIMMGGTDVKKYSKKLIYLIDNSFENIVINAISNDNTILDTSYKNEVVINSFVSSSKIKELMIKSDFALIGAGQTIYEAIATSTPFIALKLAENQDNNINAIKSLIDDEVVLEDLEDLFDEKIKKKLLLIKDYNKRNSLKIKSENLIDGKGSSRIIDILVKHERLENICIRSAVEKDIEEIYSLSNDKQVRKNSTNKKKISWAEHVTWYHNKLQDKNNLFLVIRNKENDEFFGQMRFDIEDYKAIVSLSLSEKIKGKGLSKKILTLAFEKLYKYDNKIKIIEALIAVNNIPSIKLFESLNFIEIKNEHSFKKFILNKGE